MSIWADCEEYHAFPFFGFPVIPSVLGDSILHLKFPKGYAPNGSQTQNLSDFVCALMGEKVLNVSDTEISMKLDPQKLPRVLYEYILEAKSR